jgi:hypothetical protein
MRPITVLAALLCTASPVVAQSRVYTNADLTSKPVTWSRTVTPEEWRGLVSREFWPLPDYPDEAVAYVIPSSPTSDVLPAPPPSTSSYADSWWSDPVLAFQLQHPIEAATAVWSHGFSRASRRHVESSFISSAPTISAPPARPSVTTGASGIGKIATRG